MSVLTPGQETFSSQLAKLTGLNPNVVRGWALAEESSGAAASRAAQGNNNWLNIGYFDSGPGALTKSQQFANPALAAQATAKFLKGEQWGASPGIRGILSTAGKSPAAQIAAIAGSGWASSGYGGGANLRKTYSLVSGQPVAATTAGLAAPTSALDRAPQASTGITMQEAAAGRALRIANAGTQAQAITQARMPLKVQADPSVATGGVAPTAAGVVGEAEKYLGTKYTWGGATPATGFDCSGFLQYVWGQKGVTIPRTTQQQVKAGTQVATSNLMPGDAIFFNIPGEGPNSHVGMYIGHGQFIQAPHTGDVVKISNLSDYAALISQARRF